MADFAIVVASHGFYATEALRSAEMIIGKQNNVGTFAITLESNLESAIDDMTRVVDGVDTTNGLLILTDIVGGTPANVSGTFAMTKEDTQVYSGFNLPILLETLLNRHLSIHEIGPHLQNMFGSTFTNINELLESGESDGDNLD